MQTYSFNYSQYKKKIPTKSKLSFLLLFVIISLLISLTIFFKPKNTSSLDFYFVEITSFQTYKEASELSAEIQKKGGSGYIYYDGKYRVFASYYTSEKDAETVVNNISNDYKSANIYKLSTKKDIITPFSKKENFLISEISKSVLSSIDSITKLIIEFDKNKISSSSLKIELSKLSIRFDEKYQEFIDYTRNNSKRNVIKEYISTINTCFIDSLAFENTPHPSATP